jgi:hypothetical protein
LTVLPRTTPETTGLTEPSSSSSTDPIDPTQDIELEGSALS